jgi:D-glycero-D-manno-heptose 1,7-bisphosphate phosphatase
MGAAAIFLDKDGTLLVDVPYNVNTELMCFHEGAGEAIRAWHKADYKLVVVSNQPGVAYGFYPEESLQPVRERLEEMLKKYGSHLSGFYYCPHHPMGSVAAYSFPCECRKPAPGMLFQAARELDIDLKSSWMIGDILNDIEAGNRAGCRTVLVDTGGETEWQQGAFREPNFHVNNWLEVANAVRRGNEASGGVT